LNNIEEDKIDPHESRSEKKEREKREKKEKKETRNIVKEIKLLKEIKDIRDELNIIKIILEQQKAISDRAFDLVEQIRVEAENKQFVRYYREMSGIDNTTREVGKMIEDAKITYDSVSYAPNLRL
jgi:hypothetical protein